MPTEISGSTGVNKIQDGTVVAGDLASSVALGKVLQVKVGTSTATATQDIATTTYTDIDGMSATITPSAGSKILCMWTIYTVRQANEAYGTKLLRDSTEVWSPNGTWSLYAAGSGTTRSVDSFTHYDTPTGANGSTAFTYKVQCAGYNSNNVGFNEDGQKTQLVLMEIAG